MRINGKRLLITSVLGVFTISLIILFISLIVKGGKPVAQPHNIKLKSYTYYSVSVGKYETRERAKIEADKIIVRGGAGYIVEFKGFNILASLYTIKADAESVAESLTASNLSAEVFIIEIPKIYVESTFDYSEVLNGLTIPFEPLCGLYYGIDGGSISLNEAKSGLMEIITVLSDLFVDFEKKQTYNIKGIRIRAEYKLVLNYLTNLLNFQNADDLSLSIKQVQFKIIYGIIDLFREIAD